MTHDELKSIADREQGEIASYSEDVKKWSLKTLTAAANKLIEASRPAHQERVRTAMKLMILSREIRSKTIQAAFPGIKIEQVETLCELKPTDDALGDTEKWIAQLQSANVTPKVMQIDKIRHVIRILA